MLVGVKDPIRLLRRIAVGVVGTVILVVGLVLLVAPGPGLVVIALTLGVFAIEYQWARRNLAAVQARARSAALKAAASRVATASAGSASTCGRNGSTGCPRCSPRSTGRSSSSSPMSSAAW